MRITAPYPSEHVEQLWKWVTEFSSQMADDNSPKTLEQVTEKHNSTEFSYGIWNNGQIAGCVWFELMGDGQYLGHLVYDQNLLTVHEKIQATKDVARELFSAGARKVYWQTFSDNRAYIAFMRRVGAKVEATFRKYTMRDGKYEDAVLLGMFAEDIR
jgi:hypothetical protein